MSSRRFSPRHRFIALTTVSVALWAGATLPAAADGEWVSSLSNASSNSFNSRWWNDPQVDRDSTRVKFQECRGGSRTTYLVEKVKLRLYRDNGIFPDHSHGTVTNLCNGSWSSWGSGLPRGSYKWTTGDILVNDRGLGDLRWITNTGGRFTVPKLWTHY